MKTEQLRKTALLLYIPLSIFWMECITAGHTLGFLGVRGALYTWLFSCAIGFFLWGITTLFNKKGRYISTLVILILVCFIFGVQQVYFTIFRTFTVLSSVMRAGDVLGDFWRETISGIVDTALPILLILLPVVLFSVFGRKLIGDEERKKQHCIIGVSAALVVSIVGMVAVGLDNSGIMSFRYVYYETFSPELSVPRFGILTTLGLDIKNTIAPADKEPESVIPETPDTGTPDAPVTTPDKPVTPPDKPVTTPESPEPETPDTPPVPETPTPEDTPPEPEVIVYEPNALDIDFDALIAGTDDQTLQTMHQYFSTREPTLKNEYTGMFEGKNLIWIVAEGFSSFALDEIHLPTITKMAGEGFVFNNFYNPIWGVSTSDGEYTTLTGLIPKADVWSFSRSGRNYMPYGFGNVFSDMGYTTKAYHNHTYTYYDRDTSHPNMGYDYKAIGNGLEMNKSWPRSDLEMMEKTVDEFINEDAFHTYYLTVSGHLEYNFIGNTMCYRHKADVKDMLDAGYSEGASAYIACQMELDLAVEYLIDRLTEAGKLEDTVIVISGDHYPYGLETEEIEELYGGDIDEAFELYHSTLIIWNSGMETVEVNKYCSSIDVMPTLMNLFGIEYDSRLIMGRDILSTAEPLVVFNNRSFIAEKGRYNSVKDEFISHTAEDVPVSYAIRKMEEISRMFDMSAKILEKDYYAKVLE